MNFYGWNILYALVSIFLYIALRLGIDFYLRYTKNSKTFIRKNMKGFWNYWFYQKMRFELKTFYTLNIVMLPLTLGFSLLALSLGWLSFMKLPIAILSALLCIVQIPSIIISGKYFNLQYYGKSFIWLAKNPAGRGWDSSLFHFGGICGLVVFAIYNISLAIS